MQSFVTIIRILLLISKCTFLMGAGINPEKQVSGRIVGGHEADPHSHPYIVSLQLRFLWVRTHLCGGTLLSDKWILTAAHCISESWIIRWLPMDAIAGLHEIDHYGRQAQVIPIEKRIPHPDYKGDVGPHDIAMLSTEMPFILGQVIQPAKLPINYKVDYSSLTLTGWGVLRSTAFIPYLPDRLQELQVTYLPHKKCYEAINFSLEEDEENPLDEDSNICTGPLYGGIAACSGDSGGPLVQFLPQEDDEINNEVTQEVTKENDIEEYPPLITLEGNHTAARTIKITKLMKNKQIPVIVGVVSWGISPCGKKGAPTVYIKVSKYIDFINHYLDK